MNVSVLHVCGCVKPYVQVIRMIRYGTAQARDLKSFNIELGYRLCVKFLPVHLFLLIYDSFYLTAFLFIDTSNRM